MRASACQGAIPLRLESARASGRRAARGSMVRLSYVVLRSRSNGAPLSTASTSLRQSSRVAGAKVALDVGVSRSVIAQNSTPIGIGQQAGCKQSACPAYRGLPRRKLLDPARVDAIERAADPHAPDHAVRRDLGERDEDKSALEQMRVRQG